MKSGNSSSSATYSKVPGANTRQAAANVINGGTKSTKPPSTNSRAGPNTRSNLANRVSSRGRGDGGDDEVMAGNNYMSDYNKAGLRSDSAKRRVGASAAAYHAMSVGLDSNAMGPNGKRNGSSQPGNEIGDSLLMKQLGSPEMLFKELKMVKRENETLKNQLEVKEKSVANYRQECTKLRKDNYDLKRQIIALKEQLANQAEAAKKKANNAGGGGGQAAANNDEEGNDLGAARAMAAAARGRGNNRRPGNEEFDAMAQIQLALQMRDYENRVNERQMLMMALHQGAGVDQAAQEEERLLQRAIEESKNMAPADDPNNPDVDRMSYEQLMALGENAGHVNRGYSKAEIDQIKSVSWYIGRTKEESCLICMENFQGGKRVKTLKCGHEYDANCIDQWLEKEKRCPVCSAPPF